MVLNFASRAALLAVCLTILLGLLAACRAEESVIEYRDSPAPPDGAPAELVAKLATDPLFGGLVEQAPVGNPDITEGTPFAVKLQDPGGSVCTRTIRAN